MAPNARISVVHAATLSLIQERSRSISLGLPPSTSTSKLIEKNLASLVSVSFDLQTRLEEKNKLAKAGRIALEEVRYAEDEVTELKSQLEGLLNLLGTDEWATDLRSKTKDSCPLLAAKSSEPEATDSAPGNDEPGAYSASNRQHYHDDVEDDAEANDALLSSQKQQMEDQDDQLDRLGASISRQHHLSLQMNEELEQQGELLEELDAGVDSTTARLGRASNQLERVRRVTREHASSCTIIGLIVILVTLIAIFK